MESTEIKNQLKMTYDELVDYLLKKYGPAQYDYFCNESCKSKNSKVSRTNEGLYCHHIDENKAILLSNDKFAVNNPFEYQKANRLVYCNVLEHLILHIKIVEEPKNENANQMEIQGIGGAVCFICPQINDYFNGYEFKQQYLINIFSLIENNFNDYIDILEYFLDVVEKNPIYKSIVTKERLSVGWDQQIVKRVYDQL
jgi:hypothetical protein